MRPRNLHFTLLAVFLAATAALAQQPPVPGTKAEIVAHIPERIKYFIDNNTVAGAVTLVAIGDDIVEFDAQGMADIEAARPMKKDSIFQIMSMTKPVTAIGIMMLAEEGKLALRDPVALYLPEFKGLRVRTNTGPDAGRLGTPEHELTIRDLITHTAGFTDGAPAAIKDYRQLMNVPLDEVVRQLAKEPFLFQPGTAWSYSSAGIEVLGRIIEVSSGKKYEDFIAQRIFQPLKMNDSFFFPPDDKVYRIAMVYEHKDGKLQPAPGTILGGDPAKHRAGRSLPRTRLGTLLHRRRPLAPLQHDAGRRHLRRPSLPHAVLHSPHDRGAHLQHSPRRLDARLRLRPRLGDRHRPARRVSRPHRRQLRPRRRIRHPGLDRPRTRPHLDSANPALRRRHDSMSNVFMNLAESTITK